MESGRIKSICLVVTILFLIMFLNPVTTARSGQDIISPPAPSPLPVPTGFIHRPIIEFFTGLSCPACMGGPHQDLEQLWAENRDDDQQPFTYVVYHELNGGGVDDLATDESKERMQFYQPGVSGTPDAEFDGGYIKLGGLSSRSIDYQSSSNAVADCKTRYDRKINPLKPLQSLRSDFKFVELFVDQVFTGEGYAVSVDVTFLGTSAFVSLEDLRASLYVFMVEDNVEAYSTVLDEHVMNNNVFRGYAIKGQQFTLANGETHSTAVEWTIPESTVPIKPGDLTAVAAVFDLDDTSSENGNQGNDAQVPRCIQSATPKSTAYDRENDIPVLTDVTPKFNGNLEITAAFDDTNGISKAYVIYNVEAQNATVWSYEEMTVTGEEVCDDSGVCYAYSDSTATAVLPAENGETVYFLILMYDGGGVEYGGLGAQGRSEVYAYTISGAQEQDFIGGLSSAGMIAAIIAICIIFFILLVLVKTGAMKRLRIKRILKK